MVDTEVDTTPPVVKSLIVDKTVEAPGTITLTAEVTDDKSGFRSGTVTFRNEKYKVEKSISVFSWNSTDETDKYTGSVELDEYTRLGDYIVKSIDFYDKAGNHLYEKTADASNLSFKVIKGEGYFCDNTPPKFKSLSLESTKITAPGSIYVTAEAIDMATDEETGEASGEGSGINNFLIEFDSIIYKDNYLKANLHLDEETGNYIGTVKVSQWTRPGDYELSYIQMVDRANNGLKLYKHSTTNENNIPEPYADYKIEVFNGGGEDNYQLRTNTDNLDEEIEKVNEGEKVLVHYTPEKDTLKKEILEEIKGKDISLTLENEGVQWIVNGKDLTDENIKDIHLSVDFCKVDEFADQDAKDRINNKAGNTPVAIITFPENGTLPGPFRVRIKTDHAMREFLGKDKGLYIYYCDNLNNEMVTVAEGVTIENDHYVPIDITHCSYYVLSPAKLSSNTQETGLLDDYQIVFANGKSAFTYTGNKIKLRALSSVPTASDDGDFYVYNSKTGKVLINGSDYMYTPLNVQDTGSYTLNVSGIGSYYGGVLNASFSVVKTSIASQSFLS